MRNLIGIIIKLLFIKKYLYIVSSYGFVIVSLNCLLLGVPETWLFVRFMISVQKSRFQIIKWIIEMANDRIVFVVVVFCVKTNFIFQWLYFKHWFVSLWYIFYNLLFFFLFLPLLTITMSFIIIINFWGLFSTHCLLILLYVSENYQFQLTTLHDWCLLIFYGFLHGDVS